MKIGKEGVILIIILAVILTICICVVCISYAKNKPYIPDATTKSLISNNDLVKIRQSYEQDKMKEKFIITFEEIEQNISKKVLDGNVVDDSTLNKEIAKINEVLLTEDWTYINTDFPKYWMGIWSVDKNVKLNFKFSSKYIEPNWSTSEELIGRIVKN